MYSYDCRVADKSTITADDVIDILAQQPNNQNKSREQLSRWVASNTFKLTIVHAALPNLGVSVGKTGHSISTGPIIVDENIQSVARFHEGIGGAAPDFMVLDGQNRVVAARKKGPRTTLKAYVGEKIFNQLKKEDAEIERLQDDLQQTIAAFLNMPSSPGRLLETLKVFVKRGILTAPELDAIRQQWRTKYRSINANLR